VRIVFALLVVLNGLQSSAVLTPERGVVLHGEQAGWLFVPRCSCKVPEPVESAWAPDSETIRRLELALGPVLQEGLKLMPERQANDYYRQYAGAVIGGERIVYINGFYGGMLDAAAATIAPRSIDPAAIPGSVDPNRIRKGHGK